MLPSVEQAFVGRDEKRAPLKTPAWEARQEEEDGKTLVCDKRHRAITWEFCRGLPLSLIFSGLLQKGLFKGRCSF